jgi:cyclophilin family peptidyl-prolyl cis-trans isomerase
MHISSNRSSFHRGGIAFVLSFVLASVAVSPTWAESPVQVTLETSRGVILVELYPDKAPKTVANFLEYVRSGYYDGTVFHRVIDGFMIQGGGFDEKLVQKETREPIQNEADNGLSNERGTIAMARTNDPHSATSQFFISVADNAEGLDHGKTGDGWGYAVFGKVIEGMDVVDEIAKVSTGMQLATTKTGPGQMRDVPRTPVVITKATAN